MAKGGIGDMMKQVQQMQAKMEAIQAELEQTEVEGTSGGGWNGVPGSEGCCPAVGASLALYDYRREAAEV